MTTYLFFDTETDGLPKLHRPVSDIDQPQLIQFAGLLVDDSRNVLSSINVLVKPLKRSIPEEASKVHGISTEKAQQFGYAPRTAMEIWFELYTKADIVVAHNIKFDAFIMAVHQHRYGQDIKLEDRECFCTMENSTALVNLPPTAKMQAAGFFRPKNPKLEECIKHFFNEDLEGAHDALVDVTACMRVYFHLKSLEQTHGAN